MTRKEILEWDTTTWARALRFWEQQIKQRTPQLSKGLEIGAHQGGVSLFFAKKYYANIVCSDIAPPIESARSLHIQHGVSHQIEYAQVDATAIPYPDASFDFVMFKSVLGGIGHHDQPEQQQKALAEIRRVLRPGGLLFFAENLRGSVLHRLARRAFVPWGKSWRYVRLTELNIWLDIFQEKELHTTGFWAALITRPHWLKNLIASLDSPGILFPHAWRYVVYGVAQK